MARAESMSRDIIQALDRETLEAALFAAVASIRGIAKGELQPPPIQVGRTGITVSMIKMGRMIVESEKEKEIVVTDVQQAAGILKQIASGGTA